MQPRANFELIQAPDPEIFAIKVSGHLTPRQKGVVEQLLEKCKQTGKSKVLFDFTDLESLGGGVAQMLGDYAADLEQDGNPPWFVGARGIVAKFLTARFTRCAPSLAATIEEASQALSGGSLQPESGVATVAPTPAVFEAEPEAEDPLDEGADFLQIVDAVNQTVSEASVEIPPVRPKPVSPKTDSGGFISLDEGLTFLAGSDNLAEAWPVLSRLLRSSSLAHRCFLFLREKDGFRHEDLHFAHDGVFATVVERRHGPIDLVDFVELELEDEEVEVLESLNCQVCVPFFSPKQLEGICFVGKVQAGDEYSAAETFGLEILSRQVAAAIWSPGASSNGNGGDHARRNRTLQRVARQLHESTDEESILSRLAHGLIGEMGISGVVALQLDESGMRVNGAWGKSVASNEAWARVPSDAWDAVTEVGPLDQFGGDWAVALKNSGCAWFVPLVAGRGARRALAISLRDPGNDAAMDHEAIELVTSQAGLALAHSDALDDARARTLLVSKTLVTLIERRLGHQTSGETDVVAEYVARLAQRMNVDRSELPDLLYGTIMRDIGMIEISDLVLKSPGKLSPEEWKLVQRHPLEGAEILRSMGFSEAACDVVRHHHERFNGQGYPHKLRGTAIPLGARMVSVVESFAAMLRETPYRPALSEEEALSVLQENWEMRYDPNVIEQFVALKQTEQDPVDLDALLVGQAPA
jgi:anti-anti-sigma regulatory factor